MTGVLFAIAPLSGVPLAGVLSPGDYGARAGAYVRVGGYLGHVGPQPDYLGAGAVAAAVASFILAWRRLLTWLVVLLAVAAVWLSLGPYQFEVSPWLSHLWLPWHSLANLPVLKEILPDQITPFISLFVAFLLALGLDALFTLPTSPTPAPSTSSSPPTPSTSSTPPTPSRPRPTPSTPSTPSTRTTSSWFDRHRAAVTLIATAVVGVAALLPLFLTFDVPLTVSKVRLPQYFTKVTPTLPPRTVLLTIPFAVSGVAQPMLWQAVDGFDFRLAGAALKTPNASGGPVQHGAPGSARDILTSLSVAGEAQPTGAAAELLTVRQALEQWHVQRVVIAGNSLDPIYASGFFTEAAGCSPGVRGPSLGLDAPTRLDIGPAGLRGAARGLPRRGERPGREGASRSSCRPASSSMPAAPPEPGPVAARAVIWPPCSRCSTSPSRCADMDEARDFYVRTLGCTVARTKSDFTDIWFYGMQVTLQDRPDEATGLQPGGSRHFGVTLDRADFDTAVARLEQAGVAWVSPVSTDEAGSALEQTKCKIADPSGNVIELKTYRDIGAALEIDLDDLAPRT